MKSKVLNHFRDKHTKKVHEADTFYEGKEGRINELVDLGFVEVVEEEKDVISVLEGNVQSVKKQLDGIDKGSLENVLDAEKEGQNRKGVIDHIESLLESE